MQVKDHRWLGLHALTIGAVAALMFVGWEYTHGGVKSHHLLNRADLPAVSNWWGLLVLPVLGLLAGEVVRRRSGDAASAIARALAAALGAMLAGALLSLVFITGNEPIAGFVLLGVFASGLLLPIYRAEYLFGFVLGMAPTFGAVLPTLVGLVAGAVSAVFQLLVYRMVAKVYRHLRT